MISGYVEVIERGSIRGWAYDAEEPGRRLRIELLSENFPVAQGAADIDRADLAVLGIGRTDFAFDLRVPADVVLDLSRLVVRPVGERQALPLSDQACAIEGSVEIVSPSTVSGWAWHVGYPKKRLELTVEVDGTPIATGEAGEFRVDLANSHVGDGRYGFRIPIAVGPMQTAIGFIKVIEKSSGQPLPDLRLAPAQRAALPRIVPPPPPPPPAIAPAARIAAPAPAAPVARSSRPAAPRTPAPARPPMAPPPPPAPVVAAPRPAPAAPPPPEPAGRVRIEQEPGTVTLSREAAEALRQAMGLGDDEDGLL